MCRTSSSADHLLQIREARGELQRLDLVERKPDALELARDGLLVVAVVGVDDEAVDTVRVALHERRELPFEHCGDALLEVFRRHTGGVVDDDVSRHAFQRNVSSKDRVEDVPKNDRLYALSETFRAFAEVTPDYRVLLETVARELTRLIGDGCVVMLLDDNGGWLADGAACARDARATEIIRTAMSRLPAGRVSGGFSARVGRTGESIL